MGSWEPRPCRTEAGVRNSEVAPKRSLAHHTTTAAIVAGTATEATLETQEEH